mgnify:CR=1 FL=1
MGGIEMLDVKDGIWGNPMSNITEEQWYDEAKKLYRECIDFDENHEWQKVQDECAETGDYEYMESYIAFQKQQSYYDDDGFEEDFYKWYNTNFFLIREVLQNRLKEESK